MSIINNIFINNLDIQNNTQFINIPGIFPLIKQEYIDIQNNVQFIDTNNFPQLSIKQYAPIIFKEEEVVSNNLTILANKQFSVKINNNNFNFESSTFIETEK